jgi:hypothetical protein
MKNFTQLLSILFLFTLIVSCEDESTESNNSNTTELVSIVEELNVNNDPTSTFTTYTIDNSLNTEIEWSYGVFREQTFTNGRMTLMEDFEDGSILQSHTFTYDNAGRLISSSGESYDATYDYVDNQILASVINYDTNGDITDTESYSFTLNANNQIIQYQSGQSDASWSASYTNGNLTSFIVSGDAADGSATFTYSSELASEPYQKERYRYGSEWRNNIMLGQTGRYAFKQLAELGENYLSSFSFIRASDGEETVSQTMSYEFDELGRLIFQNRNKFWGNSIYNYDITYTYQ